jgi:hypothetical protein
VKSVARFLIRLYPATWRARYGEEFEALLEDSSPGWPATFDLLKGAIQMQFSLPAFPKLALLLSTTGLLIGLLVSALLTPIYISSTELQMTIPQEAPAGSAPPPDNRNLTEHLLQLEQELLSRSTLSAIIQKPFLDLYKAERAGTPLEDVIQQMRTQDIRIRIDGPPGTSPVRLHFNISFAYPDRVKAQQTVQALLVRLMEANLHDARAHAQFTVGQLDQVRRLEARVALLEKRLGIPSAGSEPGDQLAVRYMGVNLEVTDPPSLPVRPAKPNRWRIMAAGFAAGFVAALVIAIFRRRPPPVAFPAQTA